MVECTTEVGSRGVNVVNALAAADTGISDWAVTILANRHVIHRFVLK